MAAIDGGKDNSTRRRRRQRQQQMMMGDMELQQLSSEEEISFAHFERQWRRQLANFERRRLRYADNSVHKESLLGQDWQQLQYQDAVDAAAHALFDVQSAMEAGVPCCRCRCHCHRQDRGGRQLRTAASD